MNESNEIDIKKIVFGNAKLLIAVPLLLAVGVFFAINLLPRTYVSVAYVDVLGDVKYADAIMRSPLVLNSAPIKSLIAKSYNEIDEKEFERKFKFNTSKLDQRDKPPFVLFEVSDSSPEGARALADALISAWIKANTPSRKTRLELEQQLIHGREELVFVSNLISRVDFEVKKVPVVNGQYDFADSMVKLHSRRDALRSFILDIEKKLEGASRELVIVEPNSPKAPEKNSANVYAMLAMIFSFLMLLLGLILNKRNDMHKFSVNPKS